MKRSQKVEYKSTKDIPTLPMGLHAECQLHPDLHKGFMHFRFEDCCVRVSEGGKELGSVEGCVGGGIELNDSASGMTFFLSPRELWDAFQASIKVHPDYERLVEARKK